MMWSKVKKNIESNFAHNLQKRVQIYITSYGKDYDVKELFNRGWITVDGKEVVSFSTPDAYYMGGSDYHYATPTICATRSNIDIVRTDKISEKGEFSKFDLSHCCYAFPDMNIREALEHESPLINMLAVMDKRVGKRKLKELSQAETHPIVKYFLNIRMESKKNRLI